jgi:Zn-dependent peptidase ImmA (M78 family)
LEKEANYFASCILMPREQVKKQRNTYKDVDKVASFFKV